MSDLADRKELVLARLNGKVQGARIGFPRHKGCTGGGTSGYTTGYTEGCTGDVLVFVPRDVLGMYSGGCTRGEVLGDVPKDVLRDL